METARKIHTVSVEVEKEAREKAFKYSTNASTYFAYYYGYIAGAASMKPIEHEKEPNDDTRH